MSDAMILFIDDEEHIRISNRQTLELAGFAVQTFERAEQALTVLSAQGAGVVVCDIRLPGISGLELLQRVRATDPELPVILISGHGDIEMAVGAIQDGAYDFIEKPFAADRLVESVRRANEKRALMLENRRLRSELLDQSTPGPRLIGRAPTCSGCAPPLLRFDTNADILILGETGTGEECVAGMLHEQSRRHSRNFVAVDCGRCRRAMIRERVVRHEAGAFTSAAERRIGQFEHADGGTLFSGRSRACRGSPVPLLRVLQERAVERLRLRRTDSTGSARGRRDQVDLRKAAAEGGFREDLYYTGNVVTMKSRRCASVGGIAAAVHHFLLTLAPAMAAKYRRAGGADEHAAGPRGPATCASCATPRNAACCSAAIARSICSSCSRWRRMPAAATSGQRFRTWSSVSSAGLIEQALTTSKGGISDSMLALGIPRKTRYDRCEEGYELDRAGSEMCRRRMRRGSARRAWPSNGRNSACGRPVNWVDSRRFGSKRPSAGLVGERVEHGKWQPFHSAATPSGTADCSMLSAGRRKIGPDRSLLKCPIAEVP